MKTLLSRLILPLIASAGLAASASFAQPPATTSSAPPPPGVAAPQANKGSGIKTRADLDPVSRSFLAQTLKQRLGLDEEQMEKMRKIVATTIAEREKNKEQGGAAVEKGTTELVDTLTPEQKDKAVGVLIEMMLRGPLKPGPGETGFGKMEPGHKPDGDMLPPEIARMMPEGISTPGIEQIIRERVEGSKSGPLGGRAARELGLTAEQIEKAKDIEKSRKGGIQKADKKAEEQFKSLLTNEQKTKYKALRDRKKKGGSGWLEKYAAPMSAGPSAEPGTAK